MLGGSLAFVVQTLPLASASSTLASPCDRHGQRNQRIAFFTGLAEQSQDFCFVHQQFAVAARFAIEPVALFVGADVGADQKQFAVFHFGVGVGQVGPTAPEGLDFCQSARCRLQKAMNMVFVPSSTVFGDDLYALIFPAKGAHLFLFCFSFTGAAFAFRVDGLAPRGFVPQVWFGVVRCRLPE